MSKVVAYNKRTGTEYIRVEEARGGLLNVITRNGGSNLAKPESIEFLEERALRPRKNTDPRITFDEPMYEINLAMVNKETGETVYRYSAEAPVEFALTLIADGFEKGKKHIELYQLEKHLAAPKATDSVSSESSGEHQTLRELAQNAPNNKIEDSGAAGGQDS